MILKVGSKGKEVKELQEALEIKADGIFGYGTEAAVKSFQKENNLYVDGIVGMKTWETLGIDTDEFPKELKYMSEDKEYITPAGLTIHRQYLDKDEYVRDYGKIEPLGFFIHHTAGWDNPYKTIRHWNNDTRGRVATQYVIGGSNIKGNTKYDGEVVE